MMPDCWTQNDGNASLSAATNKSAAAHLPRNDTNTSASQTCFAINNSHLCIMYAYEPPSTCATMFSLTHNFGKGK